MYISELTVEGFRAFNQPFTGKLNKGLTVMVGENGAGKTGVIGALRQLFVDSEAGRYAVDDQDFHLGFAVGDARAPGFKVSATFSDLDNLLPNPMRKSNFAFVILKQHLDLFIFWCQKLM